MTRWKDEVILLMPITFRPTLKQRIGLLLGKQVTVRDVEVSLRWKPEDNAKVSVLVDYATILAKTEVS